METPTTTQSSSSPASTMYNMPPPTLPTPPVVVEFVNLPPAYTTVTRTRNMCGDTYMLRNTSTTKSFPFTRTQLELVVAELGALGTVYLTLRPDKSIGKTDKVLMEKLVFEESGETRCTLAVKQHEQHLIVWIQIHKLLYDRTSNLEEMVWRPIMNFRVDMLRDNFYQYVE